MLEDNVTSELIMDHLHVGGNVSSDLIMDHLHVGG